MSHVTKPTSSQVRRTLKDTLDALCNMPGGWVVDENNRTALRHAADWLLNDDRRIGMGVRGPCGTGKSKLMEATGHVLQIMTGKGIHCIEAVELASMASGKDGRQLLKQYADPYKYPHLCIEDLLTEKNAPSYVKGDDGINCVTELIQMRYKHWERGARMSTSYTTNGTNDQLHDRYGERCMSRIAHKTKVVPMTGPDRRLTAVIPPPLQVTIPYEHAEGTGPVDPKVGAMIADFRSEHDLRRLDRSRELAERKQDYLDKMKERVLKMNLAELHHVIQMDAFMEARDIARTRFNYVSPIDYDQFLKELQKQKTR